MILVPDFVNDTRHENLSHSPEIPWEIRLLSQELVSRVTKLQLFVVVEVADVFDVREQLFESDSSESESLHDVVSKKAAAPVMARVELKTWNVLFFEKPISNILFGSLLIILT